MRCALEALRNPTPRHRLIAVLLPPGEGGAQRRMRDASACRVLALAQASCELPESSLTRLRHPLPGEREKAGHGLGSVTPQRRRNLLSFSLREKVARSVG